MPKFKWLKNWNNYYYFKDAPVHISSITLNKNSISLNSAWQTEQLIATVSPDDAVEKHVFWSSSDLTVATVTQTGLVTCITPGSCTITARCDWVSTTCEVSRVFSVDLLAIWWGGWWWDWRQWWDWNAVWGWGWAWWVINQQCVAFQSWIYNITIWTWWWCWCPWCNWWDTSICGSWLLQNIIAKWWWGWGIWADWSLNGLNWWSWWWWWWRYNCCWIWWSWVEWQWNCWWIACNTYRDGYVPWWWWGWWASEIWCNWRDYQWYSDIGIWWKWWDWICSDISWELLRYAWWWGWWSSKRQYTCWVWWCWWGWNWWWYCNTAASWNYYWWWGGGGAWCGWASYVKGNWWTWYQWLVIIRYKTDWSCWITNATGWCKYTCGDYTIHCFTSDWAFCIIW